MTARAQRFAAVIAEIDAANARDPNRIEIDAPRRPSWFMAAA